MELLADENVETEWIQALRDDGHDDVASLVGSPFCLADVLVAEEWTHGEAKGIYEQLSLVDVQPLVEVHIVDL